MLTLNVKDTKKQYVQVHHMALSGLELTYSPQLKPGDSRIRTAFAY